MRTFVRALVLLHVLQLVHAFNASIINGILTLPDGSHKQVGSTGTAINAVISSYFLPLPPPNVTVGWVNSSVLSYLTLGGAFVVDATVLLPSLFVLKLEAGATLTANASAADAVLFANHTHHTAVLGSAGATVSCAGWSGPAGAMFRGVYAYNTAYFTVAGFRVTACGAGASGNVHLSELGQPPPLSGYSLSG